MIFVALVFGAIADKLGFHPAIGAYFAGLFLKGEYFVVDSDNKLKSHKEEAKFVIDHLAFTIFGPIFFVNLGSKIIFDIEIFLNVLPATLTLFVSVFIFQILSATLSAKFTGGYRWNDSIMIGFGMLGRAELAFIVLNIAFVQSHIIDIEQFYTLVFTVFLLNLSVPLTIKWWKPYYEGEKELKILGITLSKESEK
jgi:Kef-type K+ transport system membrane component KefB